VNRINLLSFMVLKWLWQVIKGYFLFV